MSTVTLDPKKRKHAEVEEMPSEQEISAMSRSERKRHREKKRRSDVNKGFDDLMSLLLEIDPEVRADAEERTSKGQCKRSLGAHEDNVLSRVDLIATAVRVLKRVHNENEKHKAMLEDFLKSKGDGLTRPLGAGGALAALDRSSLLQKSALGLGAAATGTGASAGAAAAAQAAWDPAAQLRARAAMLGAVSAGGAPSLRDYSTADLLALRAANRPGAPTSDAALLTQFNSKQALQRSIFMQNMLSTGGGAESIYGALNQQDPPAQSAGSFSITEGLYGALGGGARPGQTALQIQKEEELRQLRAAGLSS